MSISDIVVLGCIAAVPIAVRLFSRKKKSGCTGCTGCTGCSGCKSCGMNCGRQKNAH